MYSNHSQTTGRMRNAWFPHFRCRSAVAVSPLPLRKFRKNYVSALRITLPTWKIPLRRCRSHLPLRRNRRSVANRIESYFCRSAVSGQPISVLVSSSLCIRKDVSSNYVLTRNGNGIATERRNGLDSVEFNAPPDTIGHFGGGLHSQSFDCYWQERQNSNGMVETRHNSTIPTFERWRFIK